MPNTRIVALDLSLTSTGVARNFYDIGVGLEIITSLIKPRPIPPNLKGRALLRATCTRLHEIQTAVYDYAYEANLVVLEGYSYGTRNHRAESIGELGGVVRLALWEASVPTVVISPSEVKKFATGKGLAAKEDVLVAAVRRFERSFRNDEADARWLLEMALCHYGLPHVPMPKTHTAVLAQIDWPELRVPEAAR